MLHSLKYKKNEYEENINDNFKYEEFEMLIENESKMQINEIGAVNGILTRLRIITIITFLIAITILPVNRTLFLIRM